VVYDAFGNRVAKTVNGVTTQYLVDELNPTGYPQVIDELSSGVVSRTYTYGLQRIDEEQVISSSWTPSFYGYDGGGNVRTLTSASGAITDSYEYDAFGNAWTVSGATPNNYLYRGEQYDPDLGLYYLRARYYNPLTGRFMSTDPLHGTPRFPTTLLRYAYAAANPVTYADPRGRLFEEYSERLSVTEQKTRFIAAIGCGVGIGFYTVSAILDWTALKEGLAEDWVTPTAVGLGCAVAFFPGSISLEGAPSMSVNITGGVACVSGFVSANNDVNLALEALANHSSEAYSTAIDRFVGDLSQSVIGCAFTSYGAINDIGGYYVDD
jgi:RHS repeat-associated protein